MPKNSMYIFFKDVKINIEIAHADRSGLVRPIIIFIWINFSNTVPIVEKKHPFMNSCLQLQQNLLSFPITTNLHNK